MIQQTTTVLSPLGIICPDVPASSLGEFGCLVAANGGGLLLGGLVLSAIVVGSVLQRRRHRKHDDRVFLVFPVDGRGRAARARTGTGAPAPSAPDPEAPRPTRGDEFSSSADSRMVLTSDVRAAADGPRSPSTDPSRERHATRTTETMTEATGRTPSTSPSEGADAPEGPVVPAAAVGSPTPTTTAAPSATATAPITSTWVEAGPVRFEEPPEGTLQLLPGRLEIESGAGAGHEVRFVRVPGNEPEVTFGRSTGPAYRHVQLRSPTVSRLHARLSFADSRWVIRNESATNPTVLNGEPLGSPTDASELSDGDQIEMGEIVFRFHQPEAGARLPFRSSWYTDRGRRPTNQDAVAVKTLSRRRELAVICDGMGSHAAGEMASHQALEALVESLEADDDLPQAVHAATLAVWSEVRDDPQRAGMGTTLVALLRRGDSYRVANVGDSRAYRIDDDGITQITEDHSFVAEVVKEGRMSRDEAARSPWRNAVTRHLGGAGEVDPDIFGAFGTGEPHLVVLCSDGAHTVLPPARIDELVRNTPSVQDMARRIGEEALREGSDDNVSVVVLQFGAGLSAKPLEGGH